MTERAPGRVIKRTELECAGGRLHRLGDHASEPTASGQFVVEPPLAAETESAELERTRRLVQAMLSGLAQQRRELIDELLPYVVRIAVEVARRIVRRELTSDPGQVTRTAQAALEQMLSAAQVVVRVHPLDAQVLRASIGALTDAPDQAKALEIVPDGSIDPGGCVVESERGIVDARLRTQFEQMQAQLLHELERGGGGW